MLNNPLVLVGVVIGGVSVSQVEAQIFTSAPYFHVDSELEAFEDNDGVGLPTGLSETLSASSWYDTNLDSRLLLVGDRGESSRMVFFEGPPPSYVLGSAASFRSRRLTGVAYDSAGGSVYVYDALSGDILQGPWIEGQDLARIRWSILTNVSSIVAATAYGPEMVLRFAGARSDYDAPAAQTRSPTTMYVQLDWSVFGGLGPPIPIVCTVDLATGVATPWNPIEMPVDFRIRQDEFREGATSVEVTVSSDDSHSIELVDVASGVTLGSATSLVGDVSVPIALSGPLVIGTEYGVRSVGGGLLPENTTTCFLKIGEPSAPAAGSGGLDMSVLEISASRLRLDSDFGVIARVTGPNRSPRGIATVVTLGVRDPVTGVDPVTPIGGGVFLLTGRQGAAKTSTLASDAPMPIVTSAPVPNTPSLIGHVLLFQAVVTDLATGQVYVSDIRGGVVGPALP